MITIDSAVRALREAGFGQADPSHLGMNDLTLAQIASVVLRADDVRDDHAEWNRHTLSTSADGEVCALDGMRWPCSEAEPRTVTVAGGHVIDLDADETLPGDDTEQFEPGYLS
jgi:hypothetical protein